MRATLEWEGLDPDEIAEMFGELNDVLLDELESAAEDIGARILGAAAQKAPVDTGQLASSIGAVVENVAEELVRVIVGTNRDGAAAQEYGTDPFFPPTSELRDWARRVLGDEAAAFPVARSISESGIDEQPYLRPAFEENLEWAMDRIKQAVNAAFEEVFG